MLLKIAFAIGMLVIGFTSGAALDKDLRGPLQLTYDEFSRML